MSSLINDNFIICVTLLLRFLLTFLYVQLERYTDGLYSQKFGPETWEGLEESRTVFQEMGKFLHTECFSHTARG